MSALGELLVEDGICTSEQIEDAVQNQVVFGGRLGTNLLELGYLEEETLARYLAQLTGRPALSGENLEPDPKALALIKAHHADRLNIVPFQLEGRKLSVLTPDPLNIRAMDEAAFVTGLSVEPLVVPEIRFWQLLRDCYGIERQLRYIALDQRDFMASALKEPPKTPPPRQADLISEEGFAKLYQSRNGFPVVQRKASTPLPSESMPTLAESDLEELGDHAGPPGDIERRVWSSPSQHGGRRKDDQPAEPEQAQPDMAASAEPDEDSSPLKLEEAMQLLAEATSRSRIARIVLRYATSVFKRAMLLTIHRGLAVGWDVICPGIDPAGFRTLMIPLEQPSAFQLVAQNRAHFLGALIKTPVHIEFLKQTGRQVPLSSFLLPILVRGRVVNILYADNGHKAHCTGNIGDLLILSQRMSACYEALFEKKRQAFLSQVAKKE